MNRPSRNDDTTEHPTWNQSPPFLASDLTTCEDLNGIANAREHRRGSDSDPNPAGLGTGDQKLPSETPTPDPAPGLYSCGRWSNGLCPLSKGSVVAVRQAPAGRRSKAVMSWIGWGVSVLVTSLLLNSIDFLGLVHLPTWKTALSDSGHDGSVGLTMPHVNVGSRPNPTPRALLIDAPVLTRRSTCSSGTAVVDYNLGLHIGALVIILCVSGFACAFSMIMRKLPRVNFSPDSVFFFMVRHFGTGVLIATAFVHLLPTAFTYLGNPCLDGFWTNDYPAMPGAIALAGIFFVTIIEMVFSPHRHINQPPSKDDDDRDLEDLPGVRENFAVVDSDTEADPSVVPTPTPQVSGPVRDMGPLRGRSNSISRQLSRVGRPAIEPTTTTHAAESSKEVYQPAPPARTFADLSHGGHGHSFVDLKQRITPEQQHKKDILQCMLLEMGILFHSVFIGMALSVSTGSEFVVLLIAISFHQTFEGLALGARIAAIEWPERSLQPWLMCLAYGCTTPIGQAIGIATHSLYDPNSEMGLILVGTMNAVSSGLLVFASLVELLSEDFLSDESWRIMRGKKRVFACLLVFAGAFGMSLVGAWA